MSNHTPGPWETNGDPYVFAGNRSIAFCDTRDGGDEDGANARLIASAPDLLEALIHLEHNASKSGANMGLALDVARAAIAKAIGANHENA